MGTASAHAGLHGSHLIRRASGWSIAIGAMFIILGMLSIIEPGLAGLAVALLVGWVLIFGGILHLISTFAGGGVGRIIWQLLLAIVYIVGGIYFLINPLLGLGTLTLFLASILLVEAVLEIVAYFQRRSEAGSGWMLMNGLITLVLGGLIWLHWPSSSVWAIGILVGVNLLMTGCSRLMLGIAARKLASRVAV